jgi:hypothetical protein
LQPVSGTLAQLVEQWTENPCVPGSIPGGTTKNPNHSVGVFLFLGFGRAGAGQSVITSKFIARRRAVRSIFFGKILLAGKPKTKKDAAAIPHAGRI